MQKTIITKAALLAIASLAAGAATAQSSLTIYGNIDIAYTNVSKKQGDVSNTVLPASSFAAPSTINGLTSSVSSVNALGFKGTEDLGGGYKAGFILEGQFQVDTGAQSGQDGRMWGRQAFASLTTPVGEVRLGRQYAPMFYAFAATTVEALGGADLQGVGLVLNNLQVRQDNQASYWLKLGGFSGVLSYSPNAGVASRISSARSITSPAATTESGQIIGGQTAGAETTDDRGKTFGILANYSFPFGLLVSGAFHWNDFGGVPVGSSTATGGQYANFFNVEKYRSFVLAGKYTIPDIGTQISAQWHQGKLETSAAAAQILNPAAPTTPIPGLNLGDIKTRTFSLGVKHPIGNFSVGAQFSRTEYTNFTEGKDTAFMLIGDYNFSKRTKVYLRAGQTKDDRGNRVATHAGNSVAIAGGPFPLLTGLGSLETPFFSGGGAHIDSRSTVVAIGIRHTF